LAQRFRHANQSAIPYEHAPRRFLADDIFPIQNTGDQQHADSQQRNSGVVNAMYPIRHPENRDEKKHQQHQPFGPIHRAHGAQLR
jgi:hypothetical protein